LVIQTDAANLNPRYPNTIVLAISTKDLPVATHVPIKAGKETGLRETSPDILRQAGKAVNLTLAL
jgi:hypothetical protein